MMVTLVKAKLIVSPEPALAIASRSRHSVPGQLAGFALPSDVWMTVIVAACAVGAGATRSARPSKHKINASLGRTNVCGCDIMPPFAMPGLVVKPANK